MKSLLSKKCAYRTEFEVQERKIAEDDLAWAFPTNAPITPGHTLIIPKRCEARYDDLTQSEKQSIERLRIQIAASLKRAFNAEGFNFAWNDGQAAGQSVPHFHLHVMPRKAGDDGVHGYEPREFLYRPGKRQTTPAQELLEVRDIIQKNLN